MKRIKVFIVDDHPVVRRGLQSLLSNYDDFQVVGDAENLDKAKAHITETMPEILLLDIRLQGESGLDLLDWIQDTHPTTKVIILTSFDEDEYVRRALRNGANGFILKSGSEDLLCDAIRTVYRNGQVLSSQVTGQLIDAFTKKQPSQEHSHTADFSEEELQILRLLVDGASNSDIANELYLSVASVKRRLQRIFVKLNVENRALAIAEAVRRRLLA